MSLGERSSPEDLVAALSPDSHVERYNRSWRFSRPRRLDGWLLGKMGFERLGERAGSTYDEELKDFVPITRVNEQVSFSHFVIELNSQTIAFEEKPPDIRRQSFIGAFQALTGVAGLRFSLDLLSDAEDFREWLGTIDRLVRVRVVVRRPNPDWTEVPELLRRLLEPSNAEEADVTLWTGDDDSESGLVVDGTVIDDAAGYVAAGHGTLRARGRAPGGRNREFSSERNVRSVQIEEDVADDSESIFERIRGRLDELLGRTGADR